MHAGSSQALEFSAHDRYAWAGQYTLNPSLVPCSSVMLVVLFASLTATESCSFLAGLSKAIEFSVPSQYVLGLILSNPEGPCTHHCDIPPES